jgi:hypothetical protein
LDGVALCVGVGFDGPRVLAGVRTDRSVYRWGLAADAEMGYGLRRAGRWFCGCRLVRDRGYLEASHSGGGGLSREACATPGIGRYLQTDLDGPGHHCSQDWERAADAAHNEKGLSSREHVLE